MLLTQIRAKKYKYADFFNIWTGHIITFEKTSDFKVANECKGTLIKFIKLIIVQKKLLTSVFLISMLISLISVLGTFIFKIIIDCIENNQSTVIGYTLSEIFIAIILLYVFQAAISVLRGYLLSLLSKKVELPLMLGYYNHIADLPIKHLLGRKTGEFISRFNDAANIQEALSGASLSLILDTLMVIICIVILFSLNHLLFFLTLITVILYAIVAICFIQPMKKINESIMESNADVTSYLKESLDGLETVKAFNAEQTVKEETANKFIKFISCAMKGSVLCTFQDSLSGLIASIGIVVLLWCGTVLVINNIISLGTLITFYSLLGFFLEPIQRLINLQPELQTAIVAAERLNDILIWKPK